MSFSIYHLVSQTILHCGTGQSVGVIDQPIARDRASYLPIVPGSTMRGVIKAALQQSGSDNKTVIEPLFGKERPDGEDTFAGALSISDAHLLLLPVRSVYGILAYATCPFILQRYQQDIKPDTEFDLAEFGQSEALCPEDSVNVKDGRIVLEDLDLNVSTASGVQDCVQRWANHLSEIVYPDDSHDTKGREAMRRRIVILPDTVFSYLAETATEIRTRIRIDPETGVVKKGALWTEESLPAESMLWGIATLEQTRKVPDNTDVTLLHKTLVKGVGIASPLQIGGHVGTGKGLVCVKFSTEGGTDENA
ncbi:MAG: hypothetical protein CENE_01657 [Candidatus Celerinatantimonas neptuna]|nr:MAG: hypothetical protein CENE_01657 [Candidatus Celerinatantimonas neptuna]